MQRGYLRRRLVPLPACRQEAVGIGLLSADIAAVYPLLRAAADPGDHPELMQAFEGIAGGAFAEVGFAAAPRIGGFQPPGFVVEKIEQEDMQDLQAAWADGAAMHAWLVGLSVKFPG